MSVKLSRYVFRKIGGRIVPIRVGAKTDSIRGVSRHALRALDKVRNKKIDKKVADFTKNSVVKNKVFHGTNATFRKFSHDKIGSSLGTSMGRGFYFSNKKSDALSYGKKVKEYFLNIKKPLKGSLNSGFFEGSSFNIKPSQIDELSKNQDLSNWGMTHSEGLSKLKKAIMGDNDLDKIQEIGQTVYHNQWKKALKKVREITGIDGTIMSNKKITHYVAFNSDQIMRAPKRSNLYKSIQKLKYRTKK